ADGTVLQTPGYDPESRLVYDPAGITFPEIPENPTLRDAEAAVEILLEPVKHYRFVYPWDRSVWLAALLTPFVRQWLPSAPMFVFNSPIRGSGKSKLAAMVGIVA